LIAEQIRQLRTGADIAGVAAAIRTAVFSAEVPTMVAEAVECASEHVGDAAMVVRAAADEPDAVDLVVNARRSQTWSEPMICWQPASVGDAVYRCTRPLDQTGLRLFDGCGGLPIKPRLTAPTRSAAGQAMR
jgi:hypothetical protein